jgi:hypothetical protein
VPPRLIHPPCAPSAPGARHPRGFQLPPALGHVPGRHAGPPHARHHDTPWHNMILNLVHIMSCSAPRQVFPLLYTMIQCLAIRPYSYHPPRRARSSCCSTSHSSCPTASVSTRTRCRRRRRPLTPRDHARLNTTPPLWPYKTPRAQEHVALPPRGPSLCRRPSHRAATCPPVPPRPSRVLVALSRGAGRANLKLYRVGPNCGPTLRL